MPNSIFAVNIKKDKLLGNVFLPFFIYKDNEKYFKKSKLVTFTDIDSQNFSFSDWVVKIDLTVINCDTNYKQHIIRCLKINQKIFLFQSV